MGKNVESKRRFNNGAPGLDLIEMIDYRYLLQINYLDKEASIRFCGYVSI